MRILEKPNKKNVREWRRAEYRQKNTKIEVHRIHEGIIIFFKFTVKEQETLTSLFQQNQKRITQDLYLMPFTAQ